MKASRLHSISHVFLLALTSACGQAASDDSSELGVSQQALGNNEVLGFESSSGWAVSGASASLSTEHSEGSSALKLSSFSHVELTSAALTTLSGVTSKLSLDVKLPQSPSWGQAQLFVDIPSRGVYSAYVGYVSLAGKPANAWNKVTFDVPANLQQALVQSYADLRFKLMLDLPSSSGSTFVDNLRFDGGTNQGPSKVEVRVTGIDELVTASVNGLVRKTWRQGEATDGQRLDVTSWFGGTSSEVRFQSINQDGDASYQIEMWVDDQLVFDRRCSSACGGPNGDIGIVLNAATTVQTRGLPARQSVALTSATPGKVYVNDAYIGKSTPTTLDLPPGDYTIGLGVSTDAPPNYTGAYYEKQVAVATAPLTVNLTSSPPLPVQETTRVVVLPIRRSINYVASLGRPDVSNTGVLTTAHVDKLISQIGPTRDVWMKPMSYGLGTWTVDVAPTVENIPIYESGPGGIDTTRFERDAAAILAPLNQQYDMTIFYFSQERADGQDVEDGLGIVWAFGGSNVGFTTTYVRDIPTGSPNVFFLHEVMHNYEAYNHNILHLYNGVQGLHSGHEHGYRNGDGGEIDYVKFYRAFLRGQVAEVEGMRPGIEWPSVPATGDAYTGVWSVMRRGFARSF